MATIWRARSASTDYVDRGRRRFLERAAMVAGVTHASVVGCAAQDPSRGWTAIGRARDWVNLPRLTAESLAGKVVVAQFCTYTCINWLRTLPYIRAWAQAYREKLIVVGIHTPEFAFEHNITNVRRALQQLKVDHPIVMDNDYSLWRAFGNNSWPALYFIDTHGRIRDSHFGEGRYEQSQRTIQRLLAEAGVTGTPGDIVPINATGVEVQADWPALRSPENYVGSDRTDNFASPEGLSRSRRLYTAPPRLRLNEWALSGQWTIGGQAAVMATSGGRIRNRFHARDLHLVMGAPRLDASIRVRVTIDGQPPGAAHGADVDASGLGTVVEPRLYQLIRQPSPIAERQFEIEFLDAGVEVFAFTFG